MGERGRESERERKKEKEREEREKREKEVRVSETKKTISAKWRQRIIQINNVKTENAQKKIKINVHTNSLDKRPPA